MTTYAEFQNNLEKDAITQSVSPGLYHMNTIQKEAKGVYPWAPTIRLQMVGASIVDGKNLVDVDSELMGINRIQTKNFQFKHKPDEHKKVNYLHLKDGLFHEESTLLTNPPSTLRGMAKNRWINVHLQPQDNVIEPFPRNGSDTYLNLVDTFKEC